MDASTVFAILALLVAVAAVLSMLASTDRRSRAAQISLETARASVAHLEAQLAELEHQQQIWDFLPVGVIVLDADLRVQVCNQQAQRILQLPGDVPHVALGDLTTNTEILNCVEHAMQQRGTVTGALTLGPGNFVELIAHALEKRGMLLILQDVSELRHLRTVRRDFVANVSHELRTPLASIRLLVDTLENGAQDDRSVATNFVHRIGIETDHLIQMVTELLELSRIESGQMPLHGREPASIEDLIGIAVQRLSMIAEDKHIEVSTKIQHSLPTVMVDRDQIVQVLLNLLFNALKFTPPKGSVLIRATSQNQFVTISVEDNGVGIPREDLTRIFERFYKSDKSRARSGGGTGLGLPIARHIVESHGGSIRAESQEGLGSTFTFTLPVR